MSRPLSAPEWLAPPVRPRASPLAQATRALTWVLLRPSRWVRHLEQVDPALPASCTLLDLTPAHWRNPLIRRVLGGYLLLIPLVVAACVAALWALGRYRTPFELILGTVGPLAIGLVLLIVPGIGVSIGAGLALGVPGAALFALAVGVLRNAGYPNFTAQTAVAYALIVGLGGSIMGNLLTNSSSPSTRFHRTQRSAWVSAVIVGTLIGALAVFVMYNIVRQMLELIFALPPIAGQPVYLPASGAQSMPLTALILLLFTAVFLLLVGWRRASVLLLVNLTCLALVLAAYSALSYSAVFQRDTPAFTQFFGRIVSLGLSTVFVSLLILPYEVSGGIAGPGAGTVAATLGPTFGWITWMTTASDLPFMPLFALAAACALTGLSFGWWGPLLLHPLLELWGLILLRVDERRRGGDASLLRWHPAFWNETHWPRFQTLQKHLVLAVERHPEEGQAALRHLAASRYQQQVAQQAQIELQARELERCADVEAIIRSRQTLAGGELDSPVSALLRSFRRISQATETALSHTMSFHQRLVIHDVQASLEALLHEMTLDEAPHTARFRPAAEAWLRLVAEQGQRLTEAVEHSQEIENPYIFGVPLSEHQELFVGRADIAASIEQLLLDRRRPPLLLYGQRRMGKTSLLRNLGRLLPENIVLLFVDGEGVAGASDAADFFYAVARAMARSARQYRQIELPPPERAELATSPFSGFNEWLDRVEQTLLECGCTALLALDEFEALSGFDGRARFDETDILRLLRHLIQHRPHFKVLLAGSHTLDEFRHWASYLINMQVIKISYLAEADVRTLVESPVKAFPLRYDPAALSRVFGLTRGHPHLVQLLCYEIVELKNGQPVDQRRLVAPADVEAAVPTALSRGDFFFSDLANQVGPHGRALLLALAARGPDGAASRTDLAPQGDAELEEALAVLLRRDVIERAGAGYRFQVELIRRWFAAQGEAR